MKLFGLEIRNPALCSLEDFENAHHIVTMNMEQFILAQENLDYKKILQDSSLIIPDGESIVLFAAWYGLKLEKLAGIDLAEMLIAKSESIVFWGAREEVSIALKKKFDNGIFFQHGYYEAKQEINLINQIKDKEIDLFLVALGSPRQEQFINKYKSFFPKATFIGVGGSFDIWAGMLSRAPKILIDLKLEWLYRIYQEPSRLKKFSKNLLALLKYLFYNGNI